MPHPKVPDQVVARLIDEHGTTTAAELLGQNIRSLKRRRRHIEQRYNKPLGILENKFQYIPHSGVIPKAVPNGVVLVGGDCHYEPGLVPIMHKAFVYLCKELKPVGVILNGDICDFACISRHDRIGWEPQHELADEIEWAQDRLGEIEKAAFRAWKAWPIGNHDIRYNTALSNSPKSAKYRGLVGLTLKDHFPLWEPCWRVDINKNVICKHRGKGGVHDSYNNARQWGCTAVTGHTHHPYVRAVTTAQETIYGVNHGCIADINQNCFVNWTEANPGNDWRSAFAILSFNSGRLLPPELAEKWDEKSFVFRGQIIKV